MFVIKKGHVVFITNMFCNQRRSFISAYLLISEASKFKTYVKGSKWIETKNVFLTWLRRFIEILAINLNRVTCNIDITLNTDINRKLFILTRCLQSSLIENNVNLSLYLYSCIYKHCNTINIIIQYWRTHENKQYDGIKKRTIFNTCVRD